MPESVLIQYDKCCLTLSLPTFFEGSTMGNIKKAFRLLRDRPRQNEAAFETLDRFFLSWEWYLEAEIKLAESAKERAEQNVRSAESKAACFGTMATKEMKAELLFAQRELKKAALDVKRAKSALERCGKIKNAYNEILR